MKSTLLFALLNGASAKWSLGSCPTVDVVTDLDTELFAGNWYEIARDRMFPYEMGADCCTRQYHLRDDGDMDFWYRAEYPLWGYGGVGGTYFDCGTSDDWSCVIN